MAGRKLGVPMRRAGMRSDADWHVCQRMRDRRAGLGLTQQQMAELIGVTSQQAHKYETGISRISAGRLLWGADGPGRRDLSSRFSSPSGTPPNSTRSTVSCSSSPATSPQSRTTSCRKPSAS